MEANGGGLAGPPLLMSATEDDTPQAPDRRSFQKHEQGYRQHHYITKEHYIPFQTRTTHRNA